MFTRWTKVQTLTLYVIHSKNKNTLLSACKYACFIKDWRVEQLRYDTRVSSNWNVSSFSDPWHGKQKCCFGTEPKHTQFAARHGYLTPTHQHSEATACGIENVEKERKRSIFSVHYQIVRQFRPSLALTHQIYLLPAREGHVGNFLAVFFVEKRKQSFLFAQAYFRYKYSATLVCMPKNRRKSITKVLEAKTII